MSEISIGLLYQRCTHPSRHKVGSLSAAYSADEAESFSRKSRNRASATGAENLKRCGVFPTEHFTFSLHHCLSRYHRCLMQCLELHSIISFENNSKNNLLFFDKND